MLVGLGLDHGLSWVLHSAYEISVGGKQRSLPLRTRVQDQVTEVEEKVYK